MLTATLITLTMLASPSPSKPPTNGRCPVLGNPVSERNQSTTVRDHSYRVCCDECRTDLEKNPEKFLNQDGSPKNASQSGPGRQLRDRY
ncbi:hypothetical protein [Mesoterricola silvestris]|uniref:TRASH domain-containing protein n=1 Tax=Mesoterricola silvestris TaxID=2927979 RepID=A0AA48H7E7_9BACT|nr:hypothetical protein [Mesoterricola silvestris]BDU73158.1 hypothetical protein METEAL_23320 [Mesoterricola silvestris]